VKCPLCRAIKIVNAQQDVPGVSPPDTSWPAAHENLLHFARNLSQQQLRVLVLGKEPARALRHARPHASLLSHGGCEDHDHALQAAAEQLASGHEGADQVLWADSEEAARRRQGRDALGRDRERQQAERELDTQARAAHAERLRKRLLAEKAEQEAERKRQRQLIKEQQEERKRRMKA